MLIPKTHTVESVTSGHPDKVCDQISDAILDAYLKEDPESRVAIEAFGSHGKFVIGGEVTSKSKVDYAGIALETYRNIGYTDALDIAVHVAQQSPDIAQGVDTGGAGDQGIMYGYATDETPEFLPKAVVQVHKLAQGLEDLRRKDKRFFWLRSDGKTQITEKLGELQAVLVSAQHDKEISQKEIRQLLIGYLIQPILGDISEERIFINPTGSFVQGGFSADTGLTGRKIMVDTYCGLVPHGGGAFSGKDPTKVDRSAAYMARFAAKNIVANGYATSCLVSVAYAIGKAEPLMLQAIDESGKDFTPLLEKHFDFRPQAIIERLILRRPIYQKTAAYGHFGKPGLPWERILSLT